MIVLCITTNTKGAISDFSSVSMICAVQDRTKGYDTQTGVATSTKNKPFCPLWPFFLEKPKIPSQT